MSGILNAFAGGSYGAKPDAPTIGTASRTASQQVTVTYTAPGFNGGVPITSYTATSSPGSITGTVSQAGSGSVIVNGLTNGTAYTFTVTATNAVGTSASSSASNSATPYTVAGAPTIGTATATTSSQATVSFTAPGSNGGSTITSYTAVSSPGSITGTLSQAGSGTITVNGLTAGVSYTFTVYATNAAGNSASSSASNSISIPLPRGAALYCSPGTYTWYAPAGVSKVSVIAVSGGSSGSAGYSQNAGGGGGSIYQNNWSVVPGAGYTVVVGVGGVGTTTYCAVPGGASSFTRAANCYIRANGGQYVCGGTVAYDFTGGNGSAANGAGMAGARSGYGDCAGSGGAGGTAGIPNLNSYCTVNQGYGQNRRGAAPPDGSCGGGSGGGGFGPSGGGGASGAYINGRGANGPSVGQYSFGGGGKGGSGGNNAGGGNVGCPCVAGAGAFPGGGGGSSRFGPYGAVGGGGVVRIIYPGCSRGWPTTCVTS
jgi:Fibronectin type III domain